MLISSKSLTTETHSAFHRISNTLVNARLALCLTSDGVLSLHIRVTMDFYVAIVSVKQMQELRKQTFNCSSKVFCVQLSDSGVQLSVAYGCCATK